MAPPENPQKWFTFTQAENNPGIVSNLPSSQVAWSTGLNVRQRVGCIYKSPGRSTLATVTNSPAVRAMFTFKGYDNVWRTLVCCDTKIYSHTNNFGVAADITPGTSGTGCTVSYTVTNGAITAITAIVGGGSGYVVGGQIYVTGGGDGKAIFTISTVSGGAITALSIASGGTGYSNGTGVATTAAGFPASGATDVWQFALIGGITILSNGVNTPWKWDLSGNPMTVLAGAPQICKALHVHKNKLIVGNIQEGAYSFPARLRWANTLQPDGGWVTDLKGLSGGKDLIPESTTTQGTDDIQAITSQDEKLIVFCERNMWYGTPAAWPLDYSWQAMDTGLGLIAPRAYVKTPKGLIYFMGQEDFHVIADGIQDIGFPIRNSVFPVLNKSKIKTAFCYYKAATREVYFCYATGSSTIPNMSAIYNEDTKGWMFEECDYLSHAFQFDSTNYTWDSLNTLPWTYWDDPSASNRWENIGDTGIIPYDAVGTSAGKIEKTDTGFNKADGTAINGYIETGDYVLDNVTLNKIIHEVIPIFKPQDTVNAVMIQVGVRENLHKDIEWNNPQAFTIGVSHHVSIRKMGKYCRIRFFTDTVDSPWTLEGYNFKYSFGGSR